jgi:putative heme transporter
MALPESKPAIAKPRNWKRLTVPLGLGVFLGLGFLALVYVFARSLAVLALSITLAEALAPLTNWLNRRMGRGLAVSIVYLSLLAMVALMAFFVVPQVVAEGTEIAERAPDLIAAGAVKLHQFMKSIPDGITPNVSHIASQFMGKVATLPIVLARTGLTILLMLFLSFYWLLAMPDIDRFTQSLIPEHRRGRAAAIRAKAGNAMGGYIRGVALNALATGVLAGSALAIAGVDYAFALGALTAAGQFFPYIGSILAAVPGVLTALLQSPAMALWTALIYIGVEQIEGHLLTPNIMRSQTDIPQPLVIFALFAGGAVGGLLGAVVAIPIAGVGKILVEEVAAPAVRKWLREATAPADHAD